MSNKPGRNDPCPCGSGKKYKKCCLNTARPQFREPASMTAAGRALEWRSVRYSKELAEALSEQFCGRSPEEFWDEVAQLPEGLQEMVQTNAMEWCLVEGRSWGGGSDEPAPRFIDLVLEHAGFSPEEQEYLELLREARLDLYEIVEVEPEEGMWMVPVLQAKPRRVWVRERTASQSLAPGSILGGRVVATDPAVLSGVVYPFSRDEYLGLRGSIMEQQAPDGSIDPEWVSTCIIDEWLDALTAPPPTFVDAASGEPMLLTTLHYRVRDWDELERLLAAEPDVEADGDGSWTRIDLEDPDKRPLCALTRKPKNRLEVFARTAVLADRAEQWLSKLAGDHLKPLQRVISDPAHLWNQPKNRKRAKPKQDDLLATMSREERTRAMQQIHEKIYADWPDQPIPALGGKTPRQAVRSKRLRREVAELVRSYQIGENEQAVSEDRDPVDFGFLWAAVGLSPRDYEF